MEEVESPSQLKGVVIITLPPADNPSLGKTITAFTISGSEPQSQSPSSQLVLPPQYQSPVQNPQVHGKFSLKRWVFANPLTFLGLLSLSLIALFSWVSINQETVYELRDADHDHESSTIIFPLYSKMRTSGSTPGDFELKLGRFTDSGSKIVLDKSSDGKSQEGILRKFAATKTKIDSTTILPVRGNIYPDGLYYTYMLVGNPPRPYFLDVDTGSDLTWIQCDAPCTSCAKGPHPFYKPKKQNLITSSNSYCTEVQKFQATKCETCQQCDYEIEYADHSSSIGVLAKDDFQLTSSNGSLVKSNLVFGCAYDQQGLLLNSLSKTDGILGLSWGKISLASQLANHGNVKNVVAHCLAADAGDGGFVLLGNDFVPHKKMAWVPMVHSPLSYAYRAELTKITYGGKQLDLRNKDPVRSLLFDSGSSYTYFAQKAYSDLVANLKDDTSGAFFQDASDDTLPICWKANFRVRSVSEVKHFFKPLDIQFGSKWWIGSTKLKIPPEGYLIISNKGNICLGILEGSNVHDGSTVILGDISLRGQLFVFDNENQKIGWIKSDCIKPRRLDAPQVV